MIQAYGRPIRNKNPPLRDGIDGGDNSAAERDAKCIAGRFSLRYNGGEHDTGEEPRLRAGRQSMRLRTYRSAAYITELAPPKPRKETEEEKARRKHACRPHTPTPLDRQRARDERGSTQCALHGAPLGRRQGWVCEFCTFRRTWEGGV